MVFLLKTFLLVFVVFFILAAFEVISLLGNLIFFLVDPSPLGRQSRVTTKVRAAPPRRGGCAGILFVVCHWFSLLHNLTVTSHQFSFF